MYIIMYINDCPLLSSSQQTGAPNFLTGGSSQGGFGRCNASCLPRPSPLSPRRCVAQASSAQARSVFFQEPARLVPLPPAGYTQRFIQWTIPAPKAPPTSALPLRHGSECPARAHLPILPKTILCLCSPAPAMPWRCARPQQMSSGPSFDGSPAASVRGGTARAHQQHRRYWRRPRPAGAMGF